MPHSAYRVRILDTVSRAHAELAAGLDHAQVASLQRHDELHPLVHGIGLGPVHPGTGPDVTTMVTGGCYPCARTTLSPMCPGWTQAPRARHVCMAPARGQRVEATRDAGLGPGRHARRDRLEDCIAKALVFAGFVKERVPHRVARA